MTITNAFRPDGGDIGSGRLREIADNVYGDEEKCWLAKRVLALLDALAAKDKQIADSENRVRQQNRHVCELFDDNTSLRQRIAELEAKLQAADTLQDGAFRHGLQHGFSYGQTNDQAGFEQCIAAYSSQRK